MHKNYRPMLTAVWLGIVLLLAGGSNCSSSGRDARCWERPVVIPRAWLVITWKCRAETCDAISEDSNRQLVERATLLESELGQRHTEVDQPNGKIHSEKVLSENYLVESSMEGRQILMHTGPGEADVQGHSGQNWNQKRKRDLDETVNVFRSEVVPRPSVEMDVDLTALYLKIRFKNKQA